MAEIYLITSGEYSDYSVHAAVVDKKDAKRLASRMNDPAADDAGWGRGYRVESIPVVTSDVQRVEILTLTAEIYDGGTCEGEASSLRVDWPFTALYPERAVSVGWRWVRAPIYRGKGGRLEVYGTDHERVRKVFGDTKAMLRTDDAMRAKQEINRTRMTAGAD